MSARRRVQILVAVAGVERALIVGEDDHDIRLPFSGGQRGAAEQRQDDEETLQGGREALAALKEKGGSWTRPT